MSYVVNDDTLLVFAEELDRKLNRQSLIESPTSRPSVSGPSSDEDSPTSSPLYAALRGFDCGKSGAFFEQLTDDKALISFIWGTLLLEVQWTATPPGSGDSQKSIAFLKLQSTVSSEKELTLRDNHFPLQFTEPHKGLFRMSHDMVMLQFEDQKKELMSKFPTSDLLDQLLNQLSGVIIRAHYLLAELRKLCLWTPFHLHSKSGGTYKLAFWILGLRRKIMVVLPLNLTTYPFETIRPEFYIPPEDRRLYTLKDFALALQMVPAGNSGYLLELMRGAKAFVKALKQFRKKKRVVSKVSKVSKESMAPQTLAIE
jgi:hypothetical protein